MTQSDLLKVTLLVKLLYLVIARHLEQVMPAFSRNNPHLGSGIRHVPVLALALDPLNAVLRVIEYQVRFHWVADYHGLKGIYLAKISSTLAVLQLREYNYFI